MLMRRVCRRYRQFRVDAIYGTDGRNWHGRQGKDDGFLAKAFMNEAWVDIYSRATKHAPFPSK